ncbi:MAG TPA: hypothetical protein PLB36_04755 [Bacillota bacterium]|nr:hypothetical protein [Candidatus Fermentithermobacillaceae bacterium]HOB30895.1 hypothetical protein [Bacillota bacterium]HOK64692.1 hypothetical protein [Bacillota bacterium]HOL12177.1 hypothetical protein [Bacillota bacterium]HOQ02215.1 hypothetical protein [Bacillota bacterium]
MTVTTIPLESYIEVEIENDVIVIFERAGDGKTQELVDLLRRYGLDLTVRVNALCG